MYALSHVEMVLHSNSMFFFVNIPLKNCQKQYVSQKGGKGENAL